MMIFVHFYVYSGSRRMFNLGSKDIDLGIKDEDFELPRRNWHNKFKERLQVTSITYFDIRFSFLKYLQLIIFLTLYNHGGRFIEVLKCCTELE